MNDMERFINEKLGPIPGKYVILEAVDSRIPRKVMQKCESLFTDGSVIFTSEPAPTGLDAQFLGFIQSDEWKDWDAHARYYLQYAIRAYNQRWTVRPALRAGKHVIQARGPLSTFAHEIRGLEAPELEGLFRLSQVAMQVGAATILTIFFDEVPEKVLENKLAEAAVREKSLSTVPDLAHFKRVRKGYQDGLLGLNSETLPTDLPDLKIVDEAVGLIKKILCLAA